MPNQQSFSPPSLDAFWNLGSAEALQLLSCDEKGLSGSSAEDRLKIYGLNTLKGASKSSAVLLFLGQFKSPVTLLLIGAAVEDGPGPMPHLAGRHGKRTAAGNSYYRRKNGVWKDIGKAAPEASGNRFCKGHTFTAIEEIRKLTKGLVTDTIKDFGLCAAIEDIVQDTMEACPVKIHCVLQPSLETPMSDKFKMNAFRIVQEQLTNILKHAKASDICIAMPETNGRFTLSIADNGTGFDNTKKSRHTGMV